MNVPQGLLYTKEHEWVKIEGDVAVMGITDHAQSALGDVTFIEIPKIGKVVKQFEPLANIESVKAASDIYAPLSGKVTAVNSGLSASPDMLNSSCYEKGWICKIEIANVDERSNLMKADTYSEYIKNIGHG